MGLGWNSIDALLKFDRSWPSWAYGTFSVQVVFNKNDAPDDQSQWRMDIHELFRERPKVVQLSQTDTRSAVTISDSEKAIGELWLRLAICPKRNFTFFGLICETYFYRRGWRDELTAQMDEQKPGGFILPNRSNDVECRVNGKIEEIVLIDGTFGAILRRV